MPATLALLHRSFPLSSAAVSEARLAVADILRELGADPAMVDMVALATSELCSNASQAAKGTTFDIEVRATEDASRVSLRVSNDSSVDDIPDRSTWRPSDPLALRGRGLGIVDAIAESLEFGVDGDRLAVVATFV